MVLNSLNAIIDDILLEIRNSDIAESESISRIQIEQWIHQYRALFIKQDLDKGRTINPGYVQIINPFNMQATGTYADRLEYISVNDIPKTIDLHYRSGLLSVKDQNGRLIQVGTEFKARLQLNRKFTANDYIAYIKCDKLYAIKSLIEQCTDEVDHTLDTLQFVELAGIFEDPTAVGKINGECYDPDNTVYPVPANMIPVIKNTIFTKELAIMLTMPTDTSNNTHDNTQNIKSE